MPDFEQLIAQQLDGTIAPADFARLQDWIEASPANARQYAQWCIHQEQVRELLEWEGSVAALPMHEAEEECSALRADVDADSVYEDLIADAVEAKRVAEVKHRARLELSAQQADENAPIPAEPERRPITLVIPRWLAYAALIAVASGLLAGLFLLLPDRDGGDNLVATPPEKVWPQTITQPLPDDLDAINTDSPEPAPAAAGFATIQRTHRATWAEGGPTAGNEELPRGRHVLSTGFAQVQMADGAVVTLQAPVAFEVVGPDRLMLDSGLLWAHVPEQAIGFTVAIANAEFVDLGTDFGVEAFGDGEAELHVMTGQVRADAELPSGPMSQVFNAGQAVATGRSLFEARPVIAEQFVRDWGDAQATATHTLDAVRYLFEAPASVLPGAIESDRHFFVFPERQNVVLEQAVWVDVSQPGRYNLVPKAGAGGELPAGTRLDSYCIHFDRVGKPVRDQGRIGGIIDFDRPIVAVIVQNTQLDLTDVLFAAPGTAYMTGDNARGLESMTDPNEPYQDMIQLTSDRKQLVVRLNTSYGIDQIRVLVQAEEPPTP